MKFELGVENQEAEKLIPPARPDGSGVGVNYADAYLKVFNRTLPDGTKIVCKRRGLKVTLTIGDKKGEGLMRRLDQGPDVKNILQVALRDAAQNIGGKILVDNGIVFFETHENKF